MISICGSPALFLDNKYARWYTELCSSRQLLTRDCYVEKHHIWPTTLGGPDSFENRVKLTGEEHFVAHWLLMKMTEGEHKRKMCYAVSYFSTRNKNFKRRLTPKEYEIARKALGDARRGVGPSITCRLAVSKAKKGVPRTTEEKRKMGEKLTKKKPYWALSPTGIEFSGDDVRELASQGLKINSINSFKPGQPVIITTGKRKGWIIANEKLLNAKAVVEQKIEETTVRRKTAVTKIWEQRAGGKLKSEEIKIPVFSAANFTDFPEMFHEKLFDYEVLANQEKKVAIDILALEENCHERLHNKNFQLQKLQTFNKQGWKLLQIFEDELHDRQDCVISRVQHALGETHLKIHARKCDIVHLDAKTARSFLHQHHLQGAGVGGNYRIGLVAEGKLLSVMVLSTARFNKQATHELIRFATHLNVSISGGASKMINEARKLIGSGNAIISYADARYGQGDTYLKIGFEKLVYSPPCYWYFYPEQLRRYHRSTFQKHKLARLLNHFDPDKTELENTAANGLLRIFDSGNNVFLMRT